MKRYVSILAMIAGYATTCWAASSTVSAPAQVTNGASVVGAGMAAASRTCPFGDVLKEIQKRGARLEGAREQALAPTPGLVVAAAAPAQDFDAVSRDIYARAIHDAVILILESDRDQPKAVVVAAVAEGGVGPAITESKGRALSDRSQDSSSGFNALAPELTVVTSSSEATPTDPTHSLPSVVTPSSSSLDKVVWIGGSAVAVVAVAWKLMTYLRK